MPIARHQFTRMFARVAELWRENATRFGDIDSRFGDGDHGVTTTKIANLVDATLHSRSDDGIRELIAALGQGVMEIGGGSAGPLYGTFIGGLAEPLADETAVDGPLLKKMLAAALAELRSITTAAIGDKTMMDAIIPAVAAAENAGDDVADILATAAAAANAGVAATENMIAKFGRARSYGDKTLGTPDAGACSSALFFQGLAEGVTA